MKHVNVAVTGAAGQIGYALIFRIASGQMFGMDTTVSLQLLELEAALPSLNGVAMELQDCAFPLLKNVICTSDVNVAMHAVNWAILVGAMPRKAGMERSDLLATNGKIFTAQGKAINENAAGDVRVFVVGNPCNTNCLIAMHSAPNIPPENFYAMTMLDANRSRAQLAAKAGVEVRGVTHLAIWGNHSTTQYPDFYNARIEGCPVTDVITDTTWLENDFIKIVQQRGAAVIKARGASSAASAANAVIDSVFHLTHDTPTGEIFSVCKRSEGEYDVPAGLIYSFPCRTEGGKLRVVNDFTHNRFAQEKLRLTTEELQGEYRAVQGLGIIA